MRNRLNLLFAFALGLTLVGSLISLAARYRVESRNKATGIAVEWSAVQDLANAQGISVEKALSHLRDQGLNYLAVNEETGADLFGRGELWLSPDGKKVLGTAGGMLRLTRAKTSAPFVPELVFEVGATGLEHYKKLSIGLDPLACDLAKRLKVNIIARLMNSPGASGANIKFSIWSAARAGATVYLPLGEQVLGQRDLVNFTADTLKQVGMLYATPEFSKISGDDKLSEKMVDRLVRLHAIQSSEVDKLGPDEFYERFVKASRERSMRLLLVRPLTTAADKPVFALGETIKELARQLIKDGGAVGQARPFVEPRLPTWVFPIIGLGVGLMCAWVILRLKFPPSIPSGHCPPQGAGSAIDSLSSIQNPPRPLGEVGEERTERGNLVLGADISPNAEAAISPLRGGKGDFLPAIAVALIVTLLSVSNRGRSFVAIAAGLSFPIAAYLILDTKRKIHPILLALAMTGISLCGGLAIAGLLNSLAYYTRVDTFSAVKLVHFGPIFVIAIWLTSHIVNFKDLKAEPVRYGQVATGFLALALLIFMAMRTGNDNPAAVSGLELKMRSLMEQFLYVRPRTKELLLGHPALLFGLFAWAQAEKEQSQKLKSLAIVALSVAAIGQTSVVNTMCHLHTPLEIGLSRIAMGLILGGVFGVVAWISYSTIRNGLKKNG